MDDWDLDMEGGGIDTAFELQMGGEGTLPRIKNVIIMQYNSSINDTNICTVSSPRALPSLFHVLIPTDFCHCWIVCKRLTQTIHVEKGLCYLFIVPYGPVTVKGSHPRVLVDVYRIA